MVFSSINFIYYFLPAFLLFYYLTPSKYKNITLLLASLLFYYYGEKLYVLLMIFTLVTTYIFSFKIANSTNKKTKNNYLLIGISIPLLFLIIFKYLDFLITNINSIFNSSIALTNLILPIGISFFTFQEISYLIDTYKDNTCLEKNFINLATYITMFPQLVAGPIVKYKDIKDNLIKKDISINNFSYGIRRFIIGLAKKVLLANSLASFVSCIKDVNASTLLYFLYAISVTMQIYFDFSGYSDMAIGLGKMLGFNFLENFNYPLISKSISEFYRRWHISLGSWFREYIYIPLGGSRKGLFFTIRNILIIWTLTGLWHGASFNFIYWGLFLGILISIEKILGKRLDKIPTFIRHIMTIILIMISFIIFDSSNIPDAIFKIKSLFGLSSIPLYNSESLYYLKSYFIIFIIAIISTTPLISIICKKINKNILNILEIIVLITLLVVSTAYLVDNSYNPFIYFRF